MKKVRMIVSAVAIFAVVGSALAFKAKGDGNLFCKDGSSRACIFQDYIAQGGTNSVELQCAATAQACNANTTTNTRVVFVEN
jgi:hypothetical protein